MFDIPFTSQFKEIFSIKHTSKNFYSTPVIKKYFYQLLINKANKLLQSPQWNYLHKHKSRCENFHLKFFFIIFQCLFVFKWTSKQPRLNWKTYNNNNKKYIINGITCHPRNCRYINFCHKTNKTSQNFWFWWLLWHQF